MPINNHQSNKYTSKLEVNSSKSGVIIVRNVVDAVKVAVAVTITITVGNRLVRRDILHVRDDVINLIRPCRISQSVIYNYTSVCDVKCTPSIHEIAFNQLTR